MPNVKLKTSEGEIFEIDLQVAKCSGTIKLLIEQGRLENPEKKVLYSPEVKSAILSKVIEWINYHKDDPEPMEDDKKREWRTDDISEWDTNFLSVEPSVLFDIWATAKSLDIEGLVDLTSKAIFNISKGKKAKDIRQIFNLGKTDSPVKQIREKQQDEQA